MLIFILFLKLVLTIKIMLSICIVLHLTVILSRNVTVKNIKRGTLFLAMINNNNIVFLLKRKLNSQAVKNKYNIQSILIGPMLIKPMTAK
jgi:hypothetical protein